MLAVNRTFKDGRVIHFEFLRIESDRGQLALVAQPRGGPPTRFALTRLDGRSAVFENPSHDFPKRIVYARKGDALEVRAEAEEKVLRWRWTRRSEE